MVLRKLRKKSLAYLFFQFFLHIVGARVPTRIDPVLARVLHVYEVGGSVLVISCCAESGRPPVVFTSDSHNATKIPAGARVCALTVLRFYSFTGVFAPLVHRDQLRSKDSGTTHVIRGRRYVHQWD